MKNLSFYQLLIAFTLAFFTIISCSKDSNTANNNEIAEETLLNRQLTNPDVTDFLVDYYKTTYTFGDTEEVYEDNKTYEVTDFLDDYYKTTYTFGDTEEVYEDNKTYEVTEVFVSSTLPIGYVVTEDVTEEFLYFAHFDRDNEEVDAFDIKNNENFLLTDFSENDGEIFEVDILEYIKDNDGTIAGRRFWGWTCGFQNCYPVNGEQQCFRRCCYHIIWFQNQCQERNVNDLPGSNPVLLNP